MGTSAAPAAAKSNVKTPVSANERHFTGRVCDACPACGSKDVRALYQRERYGRQWRLARCRACGQHYTDPAPSSAQIAGFYGPPYHARLREPGATEVVFGRKFRRYIQRVRQFVVPPARTLDIGCATGLLPKLLRDAGYHAEGIELNADSANWGREQYQIPIRVGGLETLGPADRFDLVTLADVLEHTPNPLDYLLSLKPFLKPRAHLLITFPDIASIEARYWYFLSRVFRRSWMWIHCRIPAHVWEFTPQTARNLFQRAGLEVVDFTRSNAEEDLSRVMAALDLPMRVVRLAPGLFGSQMEFIVRNGK